MYSEAFVEKDFEQVCKKVSSFVDNCFITSEWSAKICRDFEVTQ
jgi:hypothetical protein